MGQASRVRASKRAMFLFLFVFLYPTCSKSGSFSYEPPTSLSINSTFIVINIPYVNSCSERTLYFHYVLDAHHCSYSSFLNSSFRFMYELPVILNTYFQNIVNIFSNIWIVSKGFLPSFVFGVEPEIHSYVERFPPVCVPLLATNIAVPPEQTFEGPLRPTVGFT